MSNSPQQTAATNAQAIVPNDIIKLTPEDIKGASLADQVKSYTNAITKLNDLRKTLSEQRKNVNDFLMAATYKDSRTYSNVEGLEFRRVTEYLVVYKPIEEVVLDPELKKLINLKKNSSIVNELYSSINSYSLGEFFGEDKMMLLKKAIEYRTLTPEIDKDATEAKKKEFTNLINPVYDTANEIVVLENEVKSLESIVNFYKSIASIAKDNKSNND